MQFFLMWGVGRIFKLNMFTGVVHISLACKIDGIINMIF